MIRTILEAKDGSYRINDVKQFVKPFFLTPDAPQQTMALAAVVGAQAYNPITVTQEGPFQGYSLIAESDQFTAAGDHGCTVMITDSGSRKRLTNRPCHMNTVFGTSQFPLVLPERLFMHENRSLTIRFQNLFAVANDIRPVISGRRIYGTSAASGVVDEMIADLAERSQTTTPYFLTTTEDVTNLTVAAGATSYFFQTDADGYMEVFKITAVCYDRTLGVLTGTFDFILRDAETRREMESGPLSNLLACGDALQPFILPESWLIRPKQRVELVVTNTNPTGNPIDVYFTLVGRKIYV